MSVPAESIEDEVMNMCESTVVLRKGTTKEIVMEDVVKIEFTARGALLIDIMGVEKELEDVSITEANLLDHEVVFEEH